LKSQHVCVKYATKRNWELIRSSSMDAVTHFVRNV